MFGCVCLKPNLLGKHCIVGADEKGLRVVPRLKQRYAEGTDGEMKRIVCFVLCLDVDD